MQEDSLYFKAEKRISIHLGIEDTFINFEI